MQNSGNSWPATQPSAPSPTTLQNTPSRKRFALIGRSHAFDPRIDAARGDLADLRLADRLFAPHYAAAALRTAIDRAPLTARAGGSAVSEILPGEPFEVLEVTRTQAWGISPVDGAVGFVRSSALGPYAGALAGDPAIDDFVSVAEGLIGTPAMPGGRSPAGIDAAGLVFLALHRAGIRVPRFVDLQVTIGHGVGESAPMLRGDLIFFDGDVAIATDGDHAVAVRDAVVRMEIAALGEIVGRRRLP